MKNMKKFFSLVLAIVMVMALAAPVMADEGDGNIAEVGGGATAQPSYTLTINNSHEGHTYEAYQIFEGDLATVNGKEVLSNIVWGSDVKNTDDLLAAINAKFNQSFTTAAAVADWLSKSVTSDSTTLDQFAAVVGGYLDTASGTSTYVQATNEKAAHYIITGLYAGYYLIKDQEGTQDGKPDAYTKYILRVLKDESVTPKSDTTTVEKTINDTLGGTYTDYEDFDITDTAYYKLEGTLPNNLNSYTSYYYKFTDTLPDGITTNLTVGAVTYGVQQIYIEGHDGNIVHTFYDITDSDNTNDTLPEGVTIKYTAGAYTRDENGAIVAVETSEKVEIEFNDLKTLYPNLLSSHKIIVKYTAFVNRDVLISAYGVINPMTNKVYLEYSNEPNGDGKGKTVEDEAYAFTFRFNVDKYDADDSTVKLEGAEFVLYYERIENNETVKYYAQVVTEEMITEKVEINGKAVAEYNLGNIYGWTTEKTAASVLDTDANGYLTVGGLDEGIYYLEETKAPAGYNLMETPVQIVITPTYNEQGMLTAVNYQVDSIAQNSATVGVRNDSGSTLPVTGGVGTTLFYVFGSILFVGAAVLLITKKRMAA